MEYVNPPYYISAYSLAVKRGFQGSLDEWLESLRGKAGDRIVLRLQGNVIQWKYMSAEGVEQGCWETLLDLSGYLREIPDTLPNPYPLLFSGAVEAVYDGSKVMEVTIPEQKEMRKLIFTGAVSAVYDGTEEVTIVIPEGGDGGVLPILAYVAEAAADLAVTAAGRKGDNTVTFLACSDMHYSSVHANTAQMQQSIENCGGAMYLVQKKIGCDFGVMLGDLIWDSGETAEQALAAMDYVNECVAAAFSSIPNFRAVGNHDCLYSSDTKLTEAEIYSKIGAKNTDLVTNPADPAGGYGYRDFNDKKLRVVLINTCRGNDGGFLVDDVQNSWISEALLAASLVDGWQCILLSHHPLDWAGSTSNIMNTVKIHENILCCFHGHVHGYKVDKLTGTDIRRVAIPNACFYRNNEYGQNGVAENAEGTEFGEDTTYPKAAGCAEDTAFCVVTVDLDSGYIWADHYGAGYSRVIPANEDAVTYYNVANQLTNAENANTAAQVMESSSYAAELSAAQGYALSEVSVTMGGVDITETAFYGGRVKIGAVTGNVVITAKAVALTGTFTNLVSTALDWDGDGVFNGAGYKDSCYVSTESPYYKSTSDGSVVTGLLEYPVFGEDGTTRYQPESIYIRGVAFDSRNTHNRVGMVNESYECTTCPWFGYIENYFTVEQLGLMYYKLTPIMNDSGQNMMAAGNIYCEYVAISANGIGKNMIVTMDEPIE